MIRRFALPCLSRSTKALCLSFGFLLLAAPAAMAGTTVSSNWAGYAAHRAGVHFSSISAQWRVPAVNCRSGFPSWSSTWAGLGGYRQTSSALDQTGTESDCSSTGQPAYAAWYELIPAPARRIHLDVAPGDTMRAVVSITGHRVTIILADLSDHRSFHRTFQPAAVDTTSAEWIVEAPSGCNQTGSCQTLPLADFGRVGFSSAQATTAAGRTATVTGPWWATTRIVLVPGGPEFASATNARSTAEAVPTGLSAGASAFSVVYRRGAGGEDAQSSRAQEVSSRLLTGRLIR